MASPESSTQNPGPSSSSSAANLAPPPPPPPPAAAELKVYRPPSNIVVAPLAALSDDDFTSTAGDPQAARATPVNPFDKLTPQGQQILIQQTRMAEAQLKELKNKIDEAKAAGKHDVAEVHSQDFAKKWASLDHFKQTINAQIINAQAMAAAAVQSQKAAKENNNNGNIGYNGNNNNLLALKQRFCAGGDDGAIVQDEPASPAKGS